MSDRDEILAMARKAGLKVWSDTATGIVCVKPCMDGQSLNVEVERLVRLAQDAAYERAAAVCEKSDRYRGDYFAEKIRALKEVK